MSDYDYEKYLETVLANIGDGRNLILGIADTTPPDASLDRILRTAEIIKRFGPVK